MSGSVTPSPGFQDQMAAIQEQQEAFMVQNYAFSAQQSDMQSMMKTYGDLADNAAKNHPQV